MRDRVEVAGYVSFYHPLVCGSATSEESLFQIGDDVIGASIWPETIRVCAKVGLPDWFQDHAKGFLYNPVKQRWDAEWPLLLTVWFGDVYPSDRHWFKGFRFECFSEASGVSIKIAQEVRLRHTVDSRRFASCVLQDFGGGHS